MARLACLVMARYVSNAAGLLGHGVVGLFRHGAVCLQRCWAIESRLVGVFNHGAVCFQRDWAIESWRGWLVSGSAKHHVDLFLNYVGFDLLHLVSFPTRPAPTTLHRHNHTPSVCMFPYCMYVHCIKDMCSSMLSGGVSGGWPASQNIPGSRIHKIFSVSLLKKH